MPAPDLPWPLFLMLLARTDRFEARDLLRIISGTKRAITLGLGQASGFDVAELADLEAAAFGRATVRYAIAQEPPA